MCGMLRAFGVCRLFYLSVRGAQHRVFAENAARGKTSESVALLMYNSP